MFRLRISFSPLFCLLALTLAAMGEGALVGGTLFALLLHETAHAAVAARYGYRLDTISLMPYGARVSGDLQGILPREEIAVAAAGPCASLLLGLVGVALWWLFPVCYGVTRAFVAANFSVGLFNLLPVFPMDGGRVLNGALCAKMHAARAQRIVGLTGAAVGVLCAAACCLGMFWGLNPTTATVAVFMLGSAIATTRGAPYTSLLAPGYRRRAIRHGLGVKSVAVGEDATLLSLVRLADGKHYDLVYVIGSDLGVRAVLDESDLIGLAAAYAPDETVGAALARGGAKYRRKP